MFLLLLGENGLYIRSDLKIFLSSRDIPRESPDLGPGPNPKMVLFWMRKYLLHLGGLLHCQKIIPCTISILFATACLSNPPLNSWTYFGPWSNRPRSCILLLPGRLHQSLDEWSPEVQKEIPRDLGDGFCECSPIWLGCKNIHRSWKLCARSVHQGKLIWREREHMSWKLDWDISHDIGQILENGHKIILCEAHL